MYDISWTVTIGKYELKMLESIKIMRSVEQLSDTAEIVLPGTLYNEAIEIESKIKRGDPVMILAGYDGNLVKEFSGYIERIGTDDGSIRLFCEDSIFKFRKSVKNKEFVNPDVKQILNYVCEQVGGFTLSCDYSFRYDKFVIDGKTGHEILKKIQEECRANIYVKESVLHVHPQYSEIFGSAKYSFQHNIEKSELQYKEAKDRIVEVVVEGKGRDGKVIRETAGATGGDKVTVKIDGVSNQSALKTLAEEHLKTKSYTGYSGSFTGWLLPFCDAGYKVSVNDKDYEFKNGDYYVLEVETSISSSGGSRKITIGKKL
jgi:hypothetical protein